jgi:3-(3-hydroxy-phenyl)propionate hydroxylase
MTNDQQRILIAGGGPVGLLCAWLLGRRGIAVRLFDNNRALKADPRAATTHPATLDLLSEDGLDDDMARVGLVAPIFQFWDRPSQQLVAQFDHAVLKSDTQHPFVVQCEQFKTAKLLLDRLRRFPNVEVLFDHDVIDVAQSADAITVQVRGPSGVVSQHGGVYLIGADGGRSTVRRRSEIPFEGFTWPERFIVLTTPFDFQAERGYCYRSYFADPGAWCNCFKVSADGSARTVAHGLSDRPGAERAGDFERCRRASAHAIVFPVAGPL